jgi:hypothetical protein
VIREAMLGHRCGNRKGVIGVTNNNKVYLPATACPPMAQVGDDSLSAASPAHLVDINAYFHGINGSEIRSRRLSA